MERDVFVRVVKAFKTQSGNTRYVLRDDDGHEYTTFKEPIARDAVAAEGRRARIEFHEQERNGFTNVYLDRVEPLESDSPAEDESADEVGWKAAIDSAPWLLGTSEPERQVDAEEFFETLKAFKDLVAEDIREGETPDR